jgi:ribosomal protein L11 methyltransferase
LADRPTWPALVVDARPSASPADVEDRLALLVDDLDVAAIEDLAVLPLPPGGLWDPSYPPVPDPPAAPVCWRIFFRRNEDRDRARARIAAELPGLTLTTVDVPDENWAARSQRSLTAVRAGRFIVAPPWDVPADHEGGQVIVIEPSMGFGTGHHPTTRLCLRALSDADVRGCRVTDIGTGSGVLAMAAALSGAREVAAIDIDADAVRSAEASAALNALPVTPAFDVADFRVRMPAQADVVLANLSGGMLTRAASHVEAAVSRGGTLIVGGFDVSEESAVRAAFADRQEIARYEEDGWVALVLRT